MAKCVVIADDLTGANATGVLMKKMNYRVFTVMHAEIIERAALESYDCILYPTDSRAAEPEIAYNRVYNICNLLKNEGVRVYANRIDSTLRGNLGSSTDAMLDSLGEEYIAICAPCFPASGRIVVGGYMLVNGQLLHHTNIALDPKKPVKVSEPALLFQQQSKYPVASLLAKELMHGQEYLTDKLKMAAAQGNRIIVIDCVTKEDLALIADAVIASGMKVVCVDPGVFTAAMTEKLFPPSVPKKNGKVLAVVGSVNSTTRVQMEELWRCEHVHNVFVNTKRLLESKEERLKEINRVVRTILEADSEERFFSVTGDGIYPEKRIDFAPYMRQYDCSMEEVSEMLNQAFAEITVQIFQSDKDFLGLYASGGDVTSAICKNFEASGLNLMDEVLPLAAYGVFLDGCFQGVHIITKGGSQGGEDAIITCMNYLKNKIV